MSRFDRLFARYAEILPEFEAFVATLGTDAPAQVRVNTLKSDPATVAGILRDGGWHVEPVPWCPWLLTLTGGPRVALGGTLLHGLGHIYLQSASSALSALALSALPGQRVLDLCAAPGSKTTLVAQSMEDRGVLVANEPSGRRCQSLLANLERMGVTCAAVTTYPGQNFPLDGRFHRVLVDAPCSGEGTWRGPNARPQAVKDAFLRHLVGQQTTLLARGYQLLEPGGELVYSTCTYAPEENEGVVASLLATSDALVLPLGLDVPGEPGLAAWQGQEFPAALGLARRLYPHRFDSEGFFVVRLARPRAE
ncbi:MAG: RsmB/NOP family class I SAM-dependent RNA methyltransferase [Deferrisomatales bacterium]|nr:RsmB/NOP family class I SAM-dependent RNA methyltransferase [Deferrisomatales bacterium]